MATLTREELGVKVSRKLQVSRQAGTVTPEQDISTDTICKKLQADGFDVEPPELRRGINTARANRRPIATGKGGRHYFWAQNKKELEPTIDGLKKKREALDRAIEGLENAEFDAPQPHASHPTVELMQQELGLEAVQAD